MALTAKSFMNEKSQIQPKMTSLGYLSSEAIQKSNEQSKQETNESTTYNNGGFLGGLGYLGEKAAVGFVSTVEGIWDYTAGGLAKFFGADDWAEQQFANDWFGDWYSHPEEWYNPSDGWKVAGDIAGGIGTSLPATAAVLIAGGITAASGGALAPAAVPLITFAVSALGAAGNATKQAYRETGELGGKEFGYGALSGATEGSLEAVSSILGTGVGLTYKAIGEKFGRKATKTIAEQGVFKKLGKGFIGEAFEEGTSTFLDPVYQRLTYNPDAKNASADEIAYAAFVGGMSGMIMSGASYGYNKVANLISGNKISSNAAETEKVLKLGEYWSDFEQKNKTGIEVYENISEKYNSLKESLASTGGEVRTAGQKIMLGELNRATVAGTYTPGILKEAANIVNNADIIAQRLNEYGYKTPDGKSLNFTADQLRKGFNPKKPKSIFSALKANPELRMLATVSATGHLIMDTARFEQATIMGKRLASQADLNRFIETATPSEINAVSQALGIENWSTLDADTLNQKITSFAENGAVQQYAERRAIVQAIQAIPEESTRPMPKMVNLRQDGSVRYSDGSTTIAITKNGDTYTIYNYASGLLSHNLTRSEVNKLLRDHNTGKADITAGDRAKMDELSELRRQAEELDTYARENIADYKKLSDPNQSMIRKVIREGRANGLSEEDVLAYARVSAHAGVDIVFDKKANFSGYNEAGEATYSDGFYDPKTNRIVVNPESKRSHERLLLHELEHTIIRGKEGRKYFKKLVKIAFDNMSEQERNDIIDEYGNFYQGKKLSPDEIKAIIFDEISAHFSERLSNRHTIERLVEAEPTLKDKILSFFKGATKDYAEDQQLSKAARKYYKTYKKLFDKFAEKNFQNNALELKKTPVTNTETDSMHVTGDNDEEAPATTNSDVDTDTRFAIKYPNFSEADISSNMDSIADMEAVATIDASKLEKTGKSPMDTFNEYFSSLGNNIASDTFGDIALPKSSAKSEIRHGITAEKIASIEAIPAVIEQGKVIFHKTKEGGVERIVVCAPIKIGEADYYMGVMLQRDARYQRLYLHNVVSVAIEREATSSSKDNLVTTGALENENNLSITSIIQRALNVKAEKQKSAKKPAEISSDTRFALDIDSEGNQLTEAQQEFFKDSKVRDSKGRLLVVYHGTPDGKFYEFSYDKAGMVGGSQHGYGFYFSDSESDAKLYTQGTGTIIRAHLNITNPIDATAKDLSSDVGAIFDRLPMYAKSNLREQYGDLETAKRQFAKWDNGTMLSILCRDTEMHPEVFNTVLLNLGYDGIVYAEDGYATEYVAFKSSQAKATTNKAPTSNPDIRYALSSEENTVVKYTEKQYNSFGWARYAEALSKKELDDLYSKIQARTTLRTFKQSSKGEAIIEVNNKPHTTLDVDNVFVFVKGTKNNFDITRVVRFAAETETEMEIIKERLYERRAFSDTHLAYLEQQGFATQYTRESTKSFDEYQELRGSGETSRGTNQDNRQSQEQRRGYYPDTGKDGETTKRYALSGDEDLDTSLSEFSADPDVTFDIQDIINRGLPRHPGASALTVGELKKVIANNTRDKVYSKKNALEIVSRFYGVSDLTAKTRGEIADALWQGLNDCTDAEERAAFAHDMAEFIVATMVTEAKVENPDVMEAQERLSYLSTYIGRITFHPDDLSEIRHIADKAGLKKILGRWGYKGKKGTNRVPMDVFAVDIAREMPGMSALEDMHPVEAFMELDAMYERAREDVKDKWISAYWDATDADMLAIVAGIEADIMKAFETEGEQSKFSKLVEGRIEYYSTRAEFWKAEHDRIKGRDRILGLLMSQAQKMKDLRLGTFANATQFDSELFKNSIEKLAKIQFRGNLNVSGTRKIMGELLQWYRKDNPLLEFVKEKNPGLYVQSVADMLESLSEGKKGFSKDELLTMYDVMSYFVKFVENYGKVFRNGKMIEALPEAQRYIGIAQENEGLKVGLFAKLSGSWYAELFNSPSALVHRMDYYERGFYTEIFEDLREAAVDAEVAEMRIMREYDEFLRSNKKYIEKASEELIEYRGQKIPKIQLIDLYMTMKRKHAWAGIALNGFPFKNLEGKVVRVPGFVTDEHISETELEAEITAQKAEIAKHFTEADRQYMAILEKGYNEDARKLKADRDMQRLGFTNATTDYYYPIRRAYPAQNIDTSDAQAEYDRVTNSSFNKDIVKGAKQEIAIESADARFRRHIHAVCQYAYLSPAIETFNRLYNMDTSGNRNHPVSVRTATENGWAKGNKYFMKLISDIQGIPTGSSEGMAALSFIRGSYAKFQLGANPKVWFNQLSSIFASSSILDADSITRGVFISSEGIDQYCPLAELRSYDNTAAMAQGVLDKQGKARSKAGRAMGKVGKFSDLLMQPIGMMDRFVVCRVFGACQVQVEKNGGAKVGTEANKIEAGKLLEKVILETQQNSIATERSAAMRSGNEILRTVTMFTSDSMKVIGRVIDAFGEISVLHSKIKAATDPDVKAELKAKLKVAKRNARKATTALVLTAVFMAGIAQLFRWLYDKEQKEDETVAQTMIVDAVGNLFGGLPLIKDVYARIFEGYGFDNYAYSSINDLLDSAINLFDTAGSIVGGEASSQDVARGIKNLTYSIGQLTGLPVRNVYNVFYGLTKRFNPETAYKIDNVFYEKNYKNDFYKAIENEDAEMASFILSLLYNERMGTDMSEAVHSELYSLSAKGYKVLPKSAPKSITVEGAEYELNEAQRAAVRGSYTASQASLEKLFTKEKYKKLTDEMKAEAVNYVYDLHYDMALEDVLSIDRGNAVLISSVIGAENLAMLHVATKGLTSDTDKLGNTISGSKRKKVVASIKGMDISVDQKLLLICASGYALQDNDIRGISAVKAKKRLLRYILNLKGATQTDKTELAEMCGFEVKNGRVVTKSVFSLG